MDRKQKSKAADNNDRNAERNLAELFAAHNLLQSNPLALLQQQMNVMAQQAGPAFFNAANQNPYNNPAATWLYLDYISRIQAAQQMLPGLNEQQQQQQQQQQRSSTSTSTPVTAAASSSGTNPTPSSSSSSRPTKQSRQPANKKIKLPADTDIIRMGSSNQRSTPPRKLPQHTTSRKNQPPKESPPNVSMFKIEDNDAPLNLSKKYVNPTPPKHPPHPLIVKDRDPHPKVNNHNNVTIIPHAHTKPENLSTPPGRYPQDFVPKPAHMAKSTLYSHVIPKIPQVGMVVKPNEKLVKKKTTVASLLAQSRQQESSAASSRSSSPEANNIDIRSSPTAPHRPWVNNPAPLVIPNIKPLQQLQHQRSSQDPSGKKPLQHHHQQQSLPPPHHPHPPQLSQKQQKNQHHHQQQQHNLEQHYHQQHQQQQQLSSATSQQQQQQSQSSENNSTVDSSAGPASNSTPADLAQPLNMGWKRETLLKGLGAQGLSGEVVYISPVGVKCKQLSEVKKHLTAGLSIKMFSFSSRLLIGDFLLPTNSTEEQNTTLKLSANQLANWLSSEGEENKKEEIRLKEERERKKQHSVLVRALELHRRAKRRQKLQNDRKLRKKAELLEQTMQQQPNMLTPQQQQLQQQQQQQQQQQLQLQQQQQQQQILQDLNASEIDEMTVEQGLHELSRVKGLRLSPQAFANLLQIYEFLHTFGETLGFDMESLPSMSNLQKAFLQVDENEEELLSVMSHLLVCAVEDPGMPNPNKHITAFGQTLKQADITFGSLSEVLRLFMEGVADSEPEAEKYSEWLHEAPFLALSPTRKSTILAFLCDLLLQNKAVLKHLEASTEYAHTARKERQQNDIKVRRLRMLCARKAVAAVAAATEQQERELAKLAAEAQAKSALDSEDAAKTKDADSKLDVKETSVDMQKEIKDGEKESKVDEVVPVEKEIKESVKEPAIEEKEKDEETKEDKEVANSNAESTLSDPSSCPSTPATQPPSVPQTPTRTSTPSLLPPPPPPAEEIDSEDQLEESESDADAKLSIDEIRMKMNQLNNMSEKLKRQMVENFKIIRSGCLGQDRWRRRYWNLPNSGGIYVEGGGTSEFTELRGLVKEFFLNGHAATVEEEEEKIEVKEEKVKPIVIKEEIKVEKSDDKLSETVDGDKIVDDKVEGDTKIEKVVEGDTKVEKIEGDKVAENEKSELEKSASCTQFEVPPPVIKIFSFAPRNGCSGKLIQVVEKVEEPESEDQVLLKKLKGNNDVWEGWWKLSDDTKEEFLEKICSKGIREKALAINLTNVQIVEGEDLDDDEIPLNVKSPEQGWDPELCYKVHLQLLESMETLEERVASASLQVKGWQLPSRKPDCLSESDIIEMVKVRLLDLESAIERRYLKPPLGKSVNDLNLSNLTELTTDKDKDQQSYHGSRALTNWRDGVSRSKTPGVLSMAIYTLDSSIAWDKSVMKASCQLCKGGDNEDKLLLCDACDRGYHTYCFKPPLEQIPDGDWFCWECINKATGIKGCIVCGKQSGGKILACDKCVKAYHLDCLNPPLAKAPRGRWHCPDHRKLSPNRKRKSENSDKTPDGVPKQKTNNKKAKSEASWCERVLEELAGHEDAWPFLDPVNTRQFPTYKKVIKNPMDLATIRSKLATYKTRENFLADVRLIFDNCETFNEDDSPVGKAGHSLRVFFESKLKF